MSQYMFGTGQLYATSVGGGAPLRVGALQDVSVEFSGDIKTLHGQYQFPLAVARGKTKVEGKVGTANIDVAAFNTIFFGQSAGVSTGTKRQAINEAGAVPGSSTYTITVANAANFWLDLGVTLVSTGQPLKQVTGAPNAGEYAVNSSTGVYTFNVAQASAAVLINYIYEDNGAGGTIELTNQLMGTTPKLQLVASQLFDSKVFTLCLYSAVAEKLSLPLKQDDFLISEFSYQAQANDAGSIGFISTTSAVGGGG